MRRPHRSAWPALLALGLVVATPVSASPEDIVAKVCGACHGRDGNSEIPTFPNLAGQQADYLAKQLDDFASGKRKNDAMAPTLAAISASDFEGLATYFSEQKPAPPRFANAVVNAAGRRLYQSGNEAAGVAACSSCHLEKGEGSERYPRLAGQNPEYTLQQMQNFKTGARGNDKGRVMRVVTERLTENEMKALADYLAGL